MLFLKILTNGEGRRSRESFDLHRGLKLVYLITVPIILILSDLIVTAKAEGVVSALSSSLNRSPSRVPTKCSQVPVIFIPSESHKTLSFKKDPPNTPNPKHLATTLIAEEPNRDLIEITHSGELSLICLASEPIFWDYEGPVITSRKFKSVNIARITTDQGNSSCFSSVVVINTQSTHSQFQFTGRYICSVASGAENNTSDNGTRDSLYLYRNRDQKAGFVFPTRGQKLMANAREKIVPCPMNDPTRNLPVVLEKQNVINNISTYLPINPEEFNAAYDPKVGFRIEAPKPGLKIQGKYRCVLNGSSAKAVVDGESHDGPELDWRLNLTYHENSKCFSCHSDTDDLAPSHIQIFPCENPLDCRLKLKMESPEYRQGGDDFKCHSQAQSNEVSKHAQENVPTGIVICRANEGTKYQYLEYWTASEVPGKPIMVNSGPVTATSVPSSALTVDMLVSYSEDTLYVNERVQFDCTGSSLIFADGFQWAIRLKNGTVRQDNPGMELKVNKGVLDGSYQYEWSLIVTSDQIVEYICRAPLITSSQWMRKSVVVTVIDGKPPVILKDLSSEAHVTFYHDQENVEIGCAAHGEPDVEWSWYKDGKELNDETQNAQPEYRPDFDGHSNASSTIIRFKKAGTNIHGTYYCKAINPKGSRTHTIVISVEERPYWKIIIAVVAIVVILVLGFLLCYMNKFRKEVVAKNQVIEHLTKQEKESFRYGRSELLIPYAHDFARLERERGGRELAMILPYDSRCEIEEAQIIIDEDNLEFLGEGFYGVVMKAKYVKDNGQSVDIALKTLREWNVTHAKALLEEIKILSYVGKHEHVVSLIGAVTKHDQYKIQLLIEYCAEGQLKKFLEERKSFFLDEINDDKISFSNNTAVTQTAVSNYVKIDYAIKTFDLIRWSYQFACGMQHLTSRKIIHGDLAARNLLLTDQRDLKISDFGLSKVIKPNQREYVSNGVLHQPWRSLAPEMFPGLPNQKHALSSATDVWAYGITLWEIFSLAEEPYPEYPNYTDEFPAILREGCQNLQPQHANSYLYSIMKNCWALNPEQRPSFEELSQKFLNLLPSNYVLTVPKNTYKPVNYVQNLEYILPQEQFEIEETPSC